MASCFGSDGITPVTLIKQSFMKPGQYSQTQSPAPAGIVTLTHLQNEDNSFLQNKSAFF